jgi:hypothetical protein
LCIAAVYGDRLNGEFVSARRHVTEVVLHEMKTDGQNRLVMVLRSA